MQPHSIKPNNTNLVAQSSLNENIQTSGEEFDVKKYLDYRQDQVRARKWIVEYKVKENPTESPTTNVVSPEKKEQIKSSQAYKLLHNCGITDKGLVFRAEKISLQDYDFLPKEERDFISRSIQSTGLSIHEVRGLVSQGAEDSSFLLIKNPVSDKPCGVISFCYHNARGDLSLNIGSVFISPEFRGKGLAKKLVQNLEKEFLNMDSSKLKEKFFAVRILPHNTPSINLFKSLDFYEAGYACQYKQFQKTIWKS